MTASYTTGTVTGNLASAVICRGRKGTGTKMVIAASNSRNVQNWLFEYLEPYQAKNYAFYVLEREKDFIEYAGNLDTVIAFVEDIFFGEKTLGKLEYYRKQYPKLQFALFSASQIPFNAAARYLRWSKGSYFSLRDREAEIQEAVGAVFNKRQYIPSYLKTSFDYYYHLPDKKPHLTHREIEIIRYLVTGKIRKEVAAVLVLSESTIRHHVSNIYDKFGIRNMIGVLRLAFSKGIISADDLTDYSL